MIIGYKDCFAAYIIWMKIGPATILCDVCGQALHFTAPYTERCAGPDNQPMAAAVRHMASAKHQWAHINGHDCCPKCRKTPPNKPRTEPAVWMISGKGPSSANS